MPINYIDCAVIPEPDPETDPDCDPANPVQELSTMILLGIGLIGIVGWQGKFLKRQRT